MPSATSRPELVLASASPRRREILASLGVQCRLAVVEEIDEAAIAATWSGPIDALPIELARAKGAVASAAHPRALVLTADTIVAVEDAVLGKPDSPEQAAAFLQRLQGATHTVYTALCLHDGPSGRVVSGTEATAVTFAPMTEDEIAWYVASGEPADKAGAYAVQGLGSLFITGLDGDYFNVVGLPVHRLRLLLAELGYDLRQWMAPTPSP